MPLLLLSAGAGAQPSSYATLDSLAANLIAGNSKSPVLFVHIDKPVQLAGNHLWFKVYLFQRSTNIPYAGSKTVIAELTDTEQNVLTQLKLESSDMLLEGVFKLPGEWVTGKYYLRAYIDGIEAATPQQVFITPVYIYNPRQAPAEDSNADCVEYFAGGKIEKGIRISPEGNWLINGVENLIAFEARDENGKPIRSKGIVKDNRDTTITSFETDEWGLAKFRINPFKARKYKILFNERELYLPEAPLSAYQLSLVQQDSSKLVFRVALSDMLYSKSPASYFVGRSKGRICFTAAGKGMYLVTVPLKNFPEGVAEFFLYDENRKLVSKRNVFIAKEDLKITIRPDKPFYRRRATAKIDVEIADANNKPVSALLSVSVVDKKMVTEALGPNIRDYSLMLFLSEPPLSQNLSQDAKEILLLTRNTSLDQVNIHQEAIADSSEGIIIKGKLLGPKKEVIAHQPISIFTEQQTGILLFDTTDEKGNFELRASKFYDSTKFLLQADGKNINASNWQIEWPEIKSATFTHLKIETRCFGRGPAEAAIRNFKHHAGDSFLVGNTRQWLQQLSSGNYDKKGLGSSGKKNGFTRMITREQLNKLNPSTTANAVKMIPGVVMLNNRLTIRGGVPALLGELDQNIEPLVIVDGVQVRLQTGVVDYLNSFQPDNIEYIEVLTGPEAAAYGTRAANGVIVLKTGLPPDRSVAGKNLLAFYPRGYHYAPVFYQPDYSNDNLRQAAFNDNRATIYWNGNLFTDEKGKASFSFYTADLPSQYLVTIMGISSRGEFICKQFIVERNN
jgi:hypothetical protein